MTDPAAAGFVIGDSNWREPAVGANEKQLELPNTGDLQGESDFGQLGAR